MKLALFIAIVGVPLIALSACFSSTKTTSSAVPPATPALKIPSPEPTDSQGSQDEALYISEIVLNLEEAKIRNMHFDEIRDDLAQAARLSAAERAASPVIADALATSKEAARFADLASCLNDQKKRGVPFYQGKSTCEAAFPDP